MIQLLIFFSLGLSQIIDVVFDENSTWKNEFSLTQPITFQIIPNDKAGQYYYIQVDLEQNNPKFMLLAQKQQPVSNPFSNLLSDGINIDATNQNQNELIRFLKISSTNENIYITTLGNVEGQFYKIKILQSNNSKICQNDCHGNGDCEAIGCLCHPEYIGIDCSIPSILIIDELHVIDTFSETNFFNYIHLYADLYDENMKLKFKTNNPYGFYIFFYKTAAIIKPQVQELCKPKLCEMFLINNYTDLDLLLLIQPENVNINQRLNFAIQIINPKSEQLNVEIQLEEYSNEDQSISDTVIIIISVVCSFTFALLIIFCSYKYYQYRLRSKNEYQQQQQQQQQASSKNYLYQIPSKEINADEYCSICLEPLNQSEQIRQTRCHHNFHTKCINLWLEKSKHDCPICRKELENS